MRAPVHRRHAVDTAVQEGPVFRDDQCRRGGTGHSRRGRGAHSIGARGAQEFFGCRSGVDSIVPGRGSLSRQGARKRGGPQPRRGRGARRWLCTRAGLRGVSWGSCGNSGGVRPWGIVRGFRGNNGNNARRIRRHRSCSGGSTTAPAMLGAELGEKPFSSQDGSTCLLRLSGCRRHVCCPSVIPPSHSHMTRDLHSAAAHVRRSSPRGRRWRSPVPPWRWPEPRCGHGSLPLELKRLLTRRPDSTRPEREAEAISDVGRHPLLPVGLREGTLEHGGQGRGGVGAPVGGATLRHGPGEPAQMTPAPRAAGSPSRGGGWSAAAQPCPPVRGGGARCCPCRCAGRVCRRPRPPRGRTRRSPRPRRAGRGCRGLGLTCPFPEPCPRSRKYLGREGG